MTRKGGALAWGGVIASFLGGSMAEMETETETTTRKPRARKQRACKQDPTLMVAVQRGRVVPTRIRAALELFCWVRNLRENDLHASTIPRTCVNDSWHCRQTGVWVTGGYCHEAQVGVLARGRDTDYGITYLRLDLGFAACGTPGVELKFVNVHVDEVEGVVVRVAETLRRLAVAYTEATVPQEAEREEAERDEPERVWEVLA